MSLYAMMPNGRIRVRANRARKILCLLKWDFIISAALADYRKTGLFATLQALKTGQAPSLFLKAIYHSHMVISIQNLKNSATASFPYNQNALNHTVIKITIHENKK